MHRLNQVLNDVFNVKLENLSDSDSPETIAEWDSLKHMILISALEKSFGIKLTTDDVLEMVSIGKIKEALSRHGINCRG